MATAVQDLLLSVANDLARQTGFVRRQRKVTGSNFARTLIVSQLGTPEGSYTQIELAAAAAGLHITRHAFEERFTPACGRFLQRLLAATTTQVVASRVTIPIFERFTRVEVLDSSLVALPDDLAAVYRGGASGTTTTAKAALKMTLALDLKTGRLRGPEWTDGRTADLAVATARADPPRGGLELADLGYFCLDKFAAWSRAGAYWLSRLKLRTAILDARGRRLDLLKTLRDAGERDLDLDVRLGTRQRLEGRLIARRVPPEVAAQRRRRLEDDARRRNQPIRALAWALAEWTVLVSNVTRTLLCVEEALALTRIRWQIERVFQLGKSHGQIDAWRTARSDKALCLVLAKMLAMVIQHWGIVVGCWGHADRSPAKAAAAVRSMAMSLALAMGSLAQLCDALEHLTSLVAIACRMEHRRSRPHAHERLLAFGPAP